MGERKDIKVGGKAKKSTVKEGLIEKKMGRGRSKGSGREDVEDIHRKSKDTDLMAKAIENKMKWVNGEKDGEKKRIETMEVQEAIMGRFKPKRGFNMTTKKKGGRGQTIKNDKKVWATPSEEWRNDG